MVNILQLSHYNKTEVLRVGSLRNTDAKCYSEFPIQWSDGPVKILGIDVLPDVKEMAEINYESLLTKTKLICQAWGKRTSTLVGRILIVKHSINPPFCL